MFGMWDKHNDQLSIIPGSMDDELNVHILVCGMVFLKYGCLPNKLDNWNETCSLCTKNFENVKNIRKFFKKFFQTKPYLVFIFNIHRQAHIALKTVKKFIPTTNPAYTTAFTVILFFIFIIKQFAL